GRRRRRDGRSGQRWLRARRASATAATAPTKNVGQDEEDEQQEDDDPRCGDHRDPLLAGRDAEAARSFGACHQAPPARVVVVVAPATEVDVVAEVDAPPAAAPPGAAAPDVACVEVVKIRSWRLTWSCEELAAAAMVTPSMTTIRDRRLRRFVKSRTWK